jgi:hypothetical protein
MPTPGARTVLHCSLVCGRVGFGTDTQQPVNEWKGVSQLGTAIILLELEGTSLLNLEYKMGNEEIEEKNRVAGVKEKVICERTLVNINAHFLMRHGGLPS